MTFGSLTLAGHPREADTKKSALREADSALFPQRGKTHCCGFALEGVAENRRMRRVEARGNRTAVPPIKSILFKFFYILNYSFCCGIIIIGYYSLF